MKVWITKYVLTQGIYEAEVEDCGDDMVRQPSREGYYPMYYHHEGTDWHKTFESARKRANTMVDRKVASLEKQISKLRKLTF